jgi:class 3 adenylate cyclase
MSVAVSDSGHEPPAERRFLTIEFIDLVGSTDLSERLDPEDLGPLLRRYHRLALSIMERFGGFVAQIFGDGILVYFGYPTAHEHEAERAVRAALALLEQLRALDTDIHGKTLPRPEARIGIHSGLVVTAEALQVSAGTSRHDVVGEAINLAARLQGEAPPGGIAISQETMELVEGLFAFRSMGLKSVKGLARKVEIYEVLRALPGTNRTEFRLRRGATRMVGREPAIERIVARWSAVKDGSRCQTLVVAGDAGVGKTRLMLELSGRPEFVDATLLQAQCHEIFASTPLYPLGDFLWARAGLTADDTESVRYEKISSYLEELGRNTDENRGLLATLLGMATPPDSIAAAPSPQLLKRAQFEFIVSIIKGAATARPVILWIEDAHWLDASSAELLQDVVAAASQLPLLVVLTMRSFPKGPALPVVDETVPLGLLGVDDCREVARSVPGAGVLSDEMIAKAIAAAEGVPFFLEQLVISLIEEHSQGPAPHRRLGGVPLMLAELMSERLDRRPGARRIAQAAACIGRSFTQDFLLTLLGGEAEPVQERLEALVDAEILLPRRRGVEVRYEFRHALLQRMAHESMLQAERRHMHRRIVEVLRATARGEPTILEALAYHLTEAAAWEEAIDAWQVAGTSAAKRSALVEATENIRSGLALLDRVPDPEARLRFELRLQVSLMGSLGATQGATSPELAACCERGLQLCTASASAAMMFPFAFGQFLYVNCRGGSSEAIALAMQFIARAESGGFESEQVLGHRMLGQAFLANGEPAKARLELERSLALYSPERDAPATHMYGQNAEVHGKSLLSLTELCLGNVDAALAAGLDALRTADALRHPHSSAIPMVYVGGWVFGLCDATEQMMTEARSLFALSEEHRLHGFRPQAVAFLGWALCQSGNPGQGIPMIAKAIEAFDSIHFRMAEAGHLANLAAAQHRVGRLTDAAVTAERAMQLMPEGSRWLEPELRRVHAVIAAGVARTDREEVEALFRSAITCAQDAHAPVFERRCLVSFREFLKSAGRRDAEVESRLGELSHLNDLGQRVTDAIKTRHTRVSYGRAAVL